MNQGSRGFFIIKVPGFILSWVPALKIGITPYHVILREHALCDQRISGFQVRDLDYGNLQDCHIATSQSGKTSDCSVQDDMLTVISLISFIKNAERLHGTVTY